MKNKRLQRKSSMIWEPAKVLKKPIYRIIRGGLAVCQSILAILSGDMEQAAELSQQATSYLQEEKQSIMPAVCRPGRQPFLHLIWRHPESNRSLARNDRIARQANNLFVMIIAACALADMQALARPA